MNIASLAETMNRDALAAGWEVQALPPVQGLPRPWFRRNAAAGGERPRLYLSAGIHGDEPAGTLAAARLLRQPELFSGVEVVLFPILNPAGLAAGTRTNQDGIDLNRDYREARTMEVATHRKALDGLGRFDAYLLLHEDWESQGVYLYELRVAGGASQAGPLLECMGRHLPIEHATHIDGFLADRGVIRRERLPERPDWPEALYLARRLCGHGYTLETPSSAPLEARIAAHVEAASCIAAALCRNRLDFCGHLAESGGLCPPS